MSKPLTVDAYIESLDGERAEIVCSLREIVLDAVPDAQESIKWAHPTYEKKGPFCYIKAFPRYVNLGFWRGAALEDPAGVVLSGGERMGHVRIRSSQDISSRVLTRLLRQAVQLNLELGDPTRVR
jgi:hypothetical protein